MMEFLRRASSWSTFAASLLEQLNGRRPLSDKQKAAVLSMAAKIGQKRGRCVCCGRELTDDISMKRGIGPTCYSKGWT